MFVRSKRSNLTRKTLRYKTPAVPLSSAAATEKRIHKKSTIKNGFSRSSASISQQERWQFHAVKCRRRQFEFAQSMSRTKYTRPWRQTSKPVAMNRKYRRYSTFFLNSCFLPFHRMLLTASFGQQRHVEGFCRHATTATGHLLQF